jgi:hypothetical protein
LASAIACGYEDAIDLDRLRDDPLMNVAVGRCPESGAALASQSTISRLENAPSKTEAAWLSAALLDQLGTTVKPGSWRCSTSMTSSARRMAANSLHSGTRITTSVVLRRCTAAPRPLADAWLRGHTRGCDGRVR